MQNEHRSRTASPSGYLARITRVVSRLALTALALTIAAAASGDHAEAQNRRGGDACTIYANPDYQGASVEFTAGQEEPWYGSRWNDAVSSVRVAPGCELEIFEHVTFNGIKAVISEDTRYVGHAWNDRISSSICRCSGRAWRRDRDQRWGAERMRGRDARDAPRRLRARDVACVAYGRAGFEGGWSAFRAGDQPVNLGRRLSDNVSSVKVANGCVALLDVGETYKLYIDRDSDSLPAGVDNAARSLDCFCR